MMNSESGRLGNCACSCCGLCAVACPNDSLEMKPVPGYRPPPTGWLAYITRYFPNYISNVRTVRSLRR